MDYDARDYIAASVTKSEKMEDAGLRVAEHNGDFIIYEVGGIFEMCTPLPAGTRMLKLQDRDVSEYRSLDESNKFFGRTRRSV